MTTNKAITISSVFFLVVYTLALFFLVSQKELSPAGEIDTYLLPIISLESRCSLFCEQADIDKARVDFPELYKGINTFEDLRLSKLRIAKNGKWVSYYFPLYSIACLPGKQVLKFLGITQSYTPPVTNVLCLVISSLSVLLFLKRKPLIKLIVMALLMANPIALYFYWQSGEILIFMLVVLSLIFFANNEHKRAGLLVSLAGMLNPTVMILGVGIILHYVFDLFA